MESLKGFKCPWLLVLLSHRLWFMYHIFGWKANGEILKSKRKKKTLLHQAAYRWREGKDMKCPSHRSLDEIQGTVWVRVAIRDVLQMNWVLLNPKAAVRHSIFALRIVLWPVRQSRRSPPQQPRSRTTMSDNHKHSLPHSLPSFSTLSLPLFLSFSQS